MGAAANQIIEIGDTVPSKCGTPRVPLRPIEQTRTRIEVRLAPQPHI